jgi:peptide/nickel transport system ATP-binding protein
MPGGEAQARAAAALAAAGVDEAERILRSYPHQLSGGMRQRVALALAVCTEPALLVADEPVSNLDIASRALILARLAQLARRDGLAILLITHDLSVVAEVADRIAVLDRGRIVETGETRSLLAQPRHPTTRALCDGVAGRPQRPRPCGGAAAADDAAGDGDDDPRSLAPVRRWLANGGAARTAEPLVVVTGASKTFQQAAAWPVLRRRPVVAVRDVSLSIGRGEILGIVGESGSGKSTLGRLIAGLEAADGGRIVVDGRSISPRALRRQRQGESWPIQMVFQDPAASLNPRLTAGEAIAEMIAHAAADRGYSDDLTPALLACVGLPAAAAGKLPDAFSGGEKQRIVLARALAARPRLLVCDEPTSALDVVNQARILDLLGRLSAGLGLTVLFISHDLTAIRRLCRRVGVMRAGRLCEVAAAAELFATPRHPYTRELVNALRATDRVLATTMTMAAADDDRTPARRSALGLNTVVEPEGQRR